MSTQNAVNQELIDLLNILTPTHEEFTVDPNYLNSIKECLEDHFGMTSFFRMGSFENGTSISGYSGVDYIAEIPTHHLTSDPKDILRDARDALSKRLQCYVYVNCPNVAEELFTDEGIETLDHENSEEAEVQGENCPAVVVPFSTDTKGSIRVIPADFIEVNDDGHKIYEIPHFYGVDEDGYWVEDMEWGLSSPAAHKAYLRRVDADLQKKVKPLIRLIKTWKYFNNIRISSYYLEKKSQNMQMTNPVSFMLRIWKVCFLIWTMNSFFWLQIPNI
ncbi:hypothetical protein C6501_18675 [Candidatus Poribacteria bacterium]|nr:MAG: hypothetical protein C6501_18675 [Candidatus Poribacteria bacterium]